MRIIAVLTFYAVLIISRPLFADNPNADSLNGKFGQYLQEARESGDYRSFLNKVYFNINRDSSRSDFIRERDKCLDSAISIAESQKIKADAGLCNIYCAQGLNKLIERQYKYALIAFVKEHEIAEKYFGKNDPVSIRSLKNLSDSYFEIGKYDSSLFYKLKEIESLKKIYEADYLGIMRQYPKLVMIYRKLGDFDKAYEYANTYFVYELKRNGAKSQSAANSLNDLGLVLMDKCDYYHALICLNKSLEIKMSSPNVKSEEIAKSYMEISQAEHCTGDNSQALEYFLKAMKLLEKEYGADNEVLAGYYDILASIYRDLKEDDKSLECEKRAIEIAEKDPEKNFQSLVKYYNSLASHYGTLAHFDKAIMYSDKAFLVCNKYNHDTTLLIVDCFLTKAGIRLKDGLIDEAIENNKSALAAYAKSAVKKKELQYHIYDNLANIFFLKGDYKNALSYFHQSLIYYIPGFKDTTLSANPTILSMADNPDAISTLGGKARCFLNLYKTKRSDTSLVHSAVSTLDLALQLIDKCRRSYKEDESKLLLTEKYSDFYEYAVEASLLQQEVNKSTKYSAQAFKYAEKSRLNVLLDAIAESQAKYRAGVPDSLINIERELKQQISNYGLFIARENEKDAADSSKLHLWQNKLFDLKQKLSVFINRMKKEYNNYYNNKYSDATSTITEIKSSLRIDDALIEYYLTDRFLCSFVITADSFFVKKIPSDSLFVKKIKEFEGLFGKGFALIQDESRKRFIELGRELYDILIRPVSSGLRGRTNLIFIPNGTLHYLPFEALIEKSSGSEFGNQKYLLHKYNVSYNYSARLFKAVSEKKKPNYDYSFIGFAPNSPFINGSKINFEKLAYTEPEVKAISNLFIKHNFQVKSYYADDARQDTFRYVIQNFPARILHIATHGIINPKTPSLSGLLFSSDSHSLEDAVLKAGEISNMKIDADLAVLSACESGLGKYARGEGLIALTRSFIYSGVNNVIFSLWMVSDKYTKELMTAFYSNVIEGLDYAASLRNAKLAMLKNEISALPSNWGSFLLLEN